MSLTTVLVIRMSIRMKSNARLFFVLSFLFSLHAALFADDGAKLAPGEHSRVLTVDGVLRSYVVYVPPNYTHGKPAPVVLALHGAAMSGPMMAGFTGLNQTADKAGFLAVYPSGTGVGPFRTWNAGGFPGRTGKPDDVVFIGKVFDDLGSVASLDAKRIFACGMSNGGMMAYRLAAEMSDRIAAIAPVAGTIAIEESKPKRPVPVIHFHGTKDTMVPYEMPARRSQQFVRLLGVEESVQTWVKLNGCEDAPKSDVLTKEGDAMKVTRTNYVGGKDGAEVVLITIENGGHTWPGKKPPMAFMGKSTLSISANELMWDFFQRNPMK